MNGMMLIAEGFETPVPESYIYGARAFSTPIEELNLLSRWRAAKRSSAEPSMSQEVT